MAETKTTARGADGGRPRGDESSPQTVREKRVLLHLWIVARCLRDGEFVTEDYYRYAERELGLNHNTALYELNAFEALGLVDKRNSHIFG
mgnify:CR=1 FL=1